MAAEPDPDHIPPPTHSSLPIDEHEDEILDSIEMNRVTIIHGETGCGKSSRVPIMILRSPPPDIELSEVKLYISQPRRIAAKALVERVRSCEPDLKDLFALRMGHGWKEYESRKTRCWFVTTGYLTRVLANSPQRFDDVSHLVIDEVHERSVDTDILCLLCRRLLESNKTIRLVLMSATLATSLYTEYFNVPNPALHVGARRYPIREYFIEDLEHFGLPPNEEKLANAIMQEIDQSRCQYAPDSMKIMYRCQVAAQLAGIVGKPGSSVLIFVPGMGEILATLDAIEELYIPGVTFTCFPIHSDIPFEEQMSAFDPPGPDEVKIIVATNAAESSVTLPDVDHVICFGLCRMITYNEKSHRQMLSSAWISRASATQRAGRTGRVRPGNVYRLYTREAFTRYMEAFEPGEMVRIPLDAVILMLKEMLNEEATPNLLECLEPPNLRTIEKSFQSLHRWGFLTSAGDDGKITTLGKFASSLGVDLLFGALIGLGIQFGLAAEAIEMAAIMSFPQTPFRRTSPAMTNAEVNEVLGLTYIARNHFDANLKSETFGLMNFLWDYKIAKQKTGFARYFGTAFSRVKQLYGVRDNLRKRVAEFLAINESRLMMETPPVHMSPAKIALLRIIHVWISGDTMVYCQPPLKSIASPDGSAKLAVQCLQGNLREEHFEEILDRSRHSFELQRVSHFQSNGRLIRDDPFDLQEFADIFEPRAISYIIEKAITAFWYYDQDRLTILMEHGVAQLINLAEIIGGASTVAVDGGFVFYEKRNNMKRRGIQERACGVWAKCGDPCEEAPEPEDRETKKLVRLFVAGFGQDFAKNGLEEALLTIDGVTSIMHWRFSPVKASNNNAHTVNFFAKLSGHVKKIESVDMNDMLGGSMNGKAVESKLQSNQVLVFHPMTSAPYPYDDLHSDQMATPFVTPKSSWKRPMFDDIPEGARLVSLVATHQRKGPSLKLLADGEEMTVLMTRSEVDMNFRWNRLDTKERVFVPDCAVPSTAVHKSRVLFCCCSNYLELKGGRAKVEGLTLLPPDPLFVLLCFLSFGTVPGDLPPSEEELNTALADFGMDSETDCSDHSSDFTQFIEWLNSYQESKNPDDVEDSKTNIDDESESEEPNAIDRISQAIEFHKSCSNMGETLCCYPEKVAELVKLFDGVGGESLSIWDSLTSNALTKSNLRTWRYEYRNSRNVSADPPNDPDRFGSVEENHHSTSSEPAQMQPIPSTSNINGSVWDKWGGIPPAMNVQTKSNLVQSSQVVQDDDKAKVNAPRSDSTSRGQKNNGNKGNKASLKKSPVPQQAINNATESSDRKVSNAKETNTNHEKEHSGPFKWEQKEMKITPQLWDECARLFATELPDGEQVSPNDLVSTNILALLFGAYHTMIAPQESRQGTITALDASHWTIIQTSDPKGKPWFSARLANDLIPRRSVSDPKLPKWLSNQRPTQPKDVRGCLPPNFRVPKSIVVGKPPALFFADIETALKIEAAFWLDAQFATVRQGKVQRWFRISFMEMITDLQRRLQATKH